MITHNYLKKLASTKKQRRNAQKVRDDFANYKEPKVKVRNYGIFPKEVSRKDVSGFRLPKGLKISRTQRRDMNYKMFLAGEKTRQAKLMDELAQKIQDKHSSGRRAARDFAVGDTNLGKIRRSEGRLAKDRIKEILENERLTPENKAIAKHMFMGGPAPKKSAPTFRSIKKLIRK